MAYKVRVYYLVETEDGDRAFYHEELLKASSPEQAISITIGRVKILVPRAKDFAGIILGEGGK
jgi:hypothetical protein